MLIVLEETSEVETSSMPVKQLIVNHRNKTDQFISPGSDAKAVTNVSRTSIINCLINYVYLLEYNDSYF